MDIAVFLAVLAAAACHAGWNAVVKGSGDPMVTTGLVSLAAGWVSLALLPIVGLPSVASLPWAVASAVVHLFYFAFLIEAYNHGDLGQVYPLARGSAPLMTGVVSSLFVEYLSVTAWAGLLLLACGVLLLALPGRGGHASVNTRGIGFALATAVTICAYSIVDGLGARASGNPNGYTLLLFVNCAITLPAYVLARRGKAAFSGSLSQWRTGLPGGVMQVISYGVAIWAMTVAPIGIVAALRETSVLFGALIAVVILKEPLHAARVAAAALIVCGLAVLKVA